MIQYPDDALQAGILEEGLKQMKEGKGDLLTEAMVNLGEIGVQGQMSHAYTVNPERDDSYVTVYSTLNGTPSTILRSMAPKVLSKRLSASPDVPQEMWGKLAFSLRQTIATKDPMFPCDLHPESPMREWLDSVGVDTICNKKLSSAFSKRRHRETRHKHEDAQIKDAEQRELDAEQREFQRATIEMMRSQARRTNVKSD